LAQVVTNTSSNPEQGIATPKDNLLGIVLLVMAGSILPYLASLRNGFVYDDDVQVLANPAIHAWRFVPTYFANPIGFYNSAVSAHYYRPVFLLWMRMNFFLWGTSARGWHLTSLALHTLASLLVFLVLCRYFQNPKFATAGALIFAVHPAHVETVVWISGCTDALMALGLLSSLYLWMRSCESSALWQRFASFAFCSMAFLTKETAIILPVMIFFHAFAGIPASGRMGKENGGRLVAALKEALPYLGLGAAYVLLRFWVLRGMPDSLHWASKAQAFQTMPSLVLFYVRHLVWPFKLSLFYDLPVVDQTDSPLFWGPLVLFAAILSGAWIWSRRSGDKRIAGAGLWFLLPLIPVLYIRFFQQDDWAHDRYLYVPVLCLSVLGGMLAEFLSKTEVREKLGTLPLVILCVAVAYLGAVTVVQARPWVNNLTLYTNAFRLAPSNTMARNNLATEYVSAGRYAEASEILKSVLKDRPEMWLANYNYGYVNYRLGNLSVAEEYFCRAIRIDSSDPDQYIYLGTTYLKEGRLAAAAEQVHRGIRRKPDGMGYHLVLGIIELQQGYLSSAREEMQKELAYHPESTGARAQLQIIERQLSGNGQ
jgi:protein O-mannosyl-transferase